MNPSKTKKKKVLLGIALVLLLGFMYSYGRNFTFALECREAGKAMLANFEANKAGFHALVPSLEGKEPIHVDLYENDTININFFDATLQAPPFMADSMYFLAHDTARSFSISPNGCLQVTAADTVELCEPNWEVHFWGHYQDPRLDVFLNYRGWSRADFNRLLHNVRALNCSYVSSDGNGFDLGYEIVPFYHDAILRAFGHEQGYFDYAYTTEPEEFYWQESLSHLDGNYYAIQHWQFW